MKKVWLVNPYGPIEGENWRSYSFNQFGKYLSEHGYKVIWWTANYAHHFKNYRSKGWKDINVNDNFIIRLVPTSSYKNNFSLGRLKKDIIFARNAYKKFKKSEYPDVIISADNPLTMDYPSFKFAKENKTPIIYDQMDLWPEFIENVAGGFVGGLLHKVLYPVYRQRRKNYRQLDGIIALGKNYLEEAKNIEKSLEKKPQALIYNGINVGKFRENLLKDINIDNFPKEKKKDEVWCIFAGTLGPSYDIETIIKCAKRFSYEGIDNIKFIIAGSGPLEELVVKASNELTNLSFIGKLLPENLIPVYGKCDIGFATYTANSNVDMPDKFYDYTAAGLAVLNSLKGEISYYVENYNIGSNYDAGNTDSFYDAIKRISDKGILNLLKRNSNELAMNFDENVQNNKLLNIINEIIK